jgi:hypothetical protein
MSANQTKPKATPKSILVLVLVSLTFAIFILEIATQLLPALIPPIIGFYFGDENLEEWGLTGDQELGLKYAPNLVEFPTPFNNDMGQRSSYPVSTTSFSYNGIGFRDDGIDGEPFAVVVGDSFASCAGVKMESCWVELLELETEKDFANLGVITYGPQQTQRMLTTYGLPLNPKLVIWVLFANDPDDAWRFDHFGKVEAREAKVWQNPIQNWLMKNSRTYLVLAFFWYNRHFFYNLATETARDMSVESNLVWWETVTDLTNPDTQESIRLAQQSILEAKQQAELQGAAFVLVIFPTREQIYYANPVFQAQLDAFSQTFVEFGRQHGLSVINLTPGFRNKIDQEPFIYFKYDIHLNERGNEIAAELLKEHLLKEAMVQ